MRDIACVTFELCQWLVVIPYSRSSVIASGDDALAVGREGRVHNYVCVTYEHGQPLAVHDVPHPHARSGVITDVDDALAVWRERRVETWELGQQVTADRIPHPRSVFKTGRDNALTDWRERRVIDEASVTLKRGQRSA